MSREVALVEGSSQTSSLLSSQGAWWLALAVSALGCSGEPDVNDPVVADTSVGTTTTEASLDCDRTRTPITNPDGALLDTLDRLAGSFPIGGAWGVPAEVDFTPNEAPVEGELVVSRRDGDLVQLGGC